MNATLIVAVCPTPINVTPLSISGLAFPGTNFTQFFQVTSTYAIANNATRVRVNTTTPPIWFSDDDFYLDIGQSKLIKFSFEVGNTDENRTITVYREPICFGDLGTENQGGVPKYVNVSVRISEDMGRFFVNFTDFDTLNQTEGVLVQIYNMSGYLMDQGYSNASGIYVSTYLPNNQYYQINYSKTGYLPNGSVEFMPPVKNANVSVHYMIVPTGELSISFLHPSNGILEVTNFVGYGSYNTFSQIINNGTRYVRNVTLVANESWITLDTNSLDVRYPGDTDVVLITLANLPEGDYCGHVNFTVVNDNSTYTLLIVYHMVEVGVNPKITLNPSEGPRGTWVQVRGFNFAGNEHVDIFWDGSKVNETTTDSDGNFTSYFMVPWNASNGNHVVNASNSKSAIEIFNVIAPPAVLSIEPEQGYVGTVVQVNGTHFNPNFTVNISWDGSVVKQVIADPNGNFTTNITASGDAGNHLIEASDGVNYDFEVFKVLSVSPTLTLSPDHGDRGVNVTVVGSGYPNNSVVSLYEDGVFLKNVSAVDGSFTTQIEIWKNATKDEHVVNGTSGVYYSFDVYTVTLPPADIYLNQTSGDRGGVIRVSGSYFIKNENINVYFDSQLLNTTTSDDQGNFSCLVRIPTSASSGNHVIKANDGAEEAFELFYVNPPPPPPYIILNPDEGEPGTIVTVSGYNYTANDNITVYWDGSPVNNTITDSSGNFQVKFQVPPDATGGLHVVNASDVNYSIATFNVTAPPPTQNAIISLSPNKGDPGQVVQVVGAYFGANEPITIRFDGQVVNTTNSNSTGGFSCTFVVPDTYGGSHLVNASDSKYALAVFNVTAPPPGQGALITLTPSYGPRGSIVKVYGKYFEPNDNVKVYWEGALLNSTTTNSSGEFVVYVTVPSNAPGGNNLVNASDSKYAIGVFNVTGVPSGPSPTITLDPKQGGIGTVVQVVGNYFPSNVDVKLYWDSTLLKQLTSNSTGGFATTFTVPSTTGGYHLVNASSPINYALDTFYVNVTQVGPQPSITINPTSGDPGTDVTIHGYNFSANVQVSIYWDTGVVKSVSTDPSGSFTTTITVPGDAVGGYHLIKAQHGSEYATATFYVNPIVLPPHYPKLTLSPTKGDYGALVNVYGSDFTNNTQVRVYWDGSLLRTLNTDANGSFVTNFMVPSGAEPGYHVVNASTNYEFAVALFKVETNLTFYNITYTCGNGVCNVELGENILNCPEDCNIEICGNLRCDVNETTATCPQDCPWLISYTCGDGGCNLSIGENALNCPEDCSGNICGNMICDENETYVSCPQDCPYGHYCGDHSCDVVLGENILNCPIDCNITICGNLRCDPGENYFNCNTDCELNLTNKCGNGRCDLEEDQFFCPSECSNFTVDYPSDIEMYEDSVKTIIIYVRNTGQVNLTNTHIVFKKSQISTAVYPHYVHVIPTGGKGIFFVDLLSKEVGLYPLNFSVIANEKQASFSINVSVITQIENVTQQLLDELSELTNLYYNLTEEVANMRRRDIFLPFIESQLRDVGEDLAQIRESIENKKYVEARVRLDDTRDKLRSIVEQMNNLDYSRLATYSSIRWISILFLILVVIVLVRYLIKKL